MADDNTKLYMELQMDELKASLETEEDSTQKEPSANVVKKKAASKNNNARNAEVAKLYEDAAEYEEELKCFEQELEIINANQLKDIPTVFNRELPDQDRDYDKELKSVLEMGWTHLVEVEKTHPQEQLKLIKENTFSKLLEIFPDEFPQYTNEFETKVREIFKNRWETIIAIKKEHIEQEMEDIYIAGLKPSFVKRIYKQFHGIS